MNLKKKKSLASKTLKVGRERIIFLAPRLDEIKEAITKQDIRDLYKEGAILIKPISGRKKVEKRVRKRGYGKVKLKVNKRKIEYMAITRKLRKIVKELLSQGKISKEQASKLREKIKNRIFKSKSHFREQLNIRY
jgi:large subunit ribosomal protein L19e